MKFVDPIPHSRGPWQDSAGTRYVIVGGAGLATKRPVTEASSEEAFAAAKGLTAVPPTGPVPSLTARQLRLWLLSDGITPEAIDAQIAAIQEAAEQARARVEWEYATEYRHDHPLVLQIGAALGLTQGQIDAGFRAAASL